MRRAGVAVGLVVVALLGGCGSGTTPLEAVAGAATKTTDARTTKVALTMKSDSGLFAKGLNENGAFDLTNRRGRFDIDTSQFGLPGAQGTVEAIFDYNAGLVIYMRFPKLAEEMPGKEWMKIDFADLMKGSGIDINSILQSQSGDPTSGLEQMRGATEVTKVGTEKVRGVDTTHYRVVIDLDKAVRESPATQRAAMQKLADLYTVKELPAEVWLDDAGRVRRYTSTIDTSTIKLPTGAQSSANPITGKMTITMEFFDFGTVVDATPPPADQVVNFQDLLPQGGSQSFAQVGSTIS